MPLKRGRGNGVVTLVGTRYVGWLTMKELMIGHPFARGDRGDKITVSVYDDIGALSNRLNALTAYPSTLVDGERKNSNRRI